MVEEGARYEVLVENWAGDGGGVARVDGMAVFVKGAIVGEACRVEIEHVGHRAAWARVVELLDPSPARTAPLCPHYGQCGGCQLCHMDYETELSFKSDKITQALRRIAGLGVEPVPVLAAPDPYFYRNKAQFPVGPNGEIGFFRQGSHQVIDVDRCLLCDETMSGVRRAVKSWMEEFSIPPYDERTHTGLLRHLYLRTGGQRDLLCVLVVNGDALPHEAELTARLSALPGMVGVVLNTNTRRTNVVLGDRTRLLWGKDHLTDALCGLTFRLSPHSFYQVNHPQAQRLYERVGELAALTGVETVLDLYCGTGTIGLTLAHRAKELIGVEVVPQAVRDAQDNARRNGVENARFLCADAGQAAAQLAQEGVRPQVVVVDPPRKGLSPEVLQVLLSMAPQRLVYVSCDPATLARDLRELAAGYDLTCAEGVDMFPRTHHVETVTLLEKRRP